MDFKTKQQNSVSLFLLIYLIPQPLLLKEKGCKIQYINILAPSPSGEGWGEANNLLFLRKHLK